MYFFSLFFTYRTEITPFNCLFCLFITVNLEYDMEGTNVALAVFIPTAVILVVVLGIYVYFAK